jgi:hypothetical protein
MGSLGFWGKLKALGKKIISGAKKVFNNVIKPAFNKLKPLGKPIVSAIGAKYGGATGAALAEGAFEAVDAGINGKFTQALQLGKQAVADHGGSVPIPNWLRKMAGGGVS